MPVLADEVQRGYAAYVRLDMLIGPEPDVNTDMLEKTADGLRYLVATALTHPDSKARRFRADLERQDTAVRYLAGAAYILGLAQQDRRRPYVPAEVPDTIPIFRSAAKTAREKLILHNLGHITNQALRYRGRGLENDVLIQEGITGFMEALDEYDPTREREAKLLTFATSKIIKTVQVAVRMRGQHFSLNTTDRRMIESIDRIRRDLTEAGKPATIQVIYDNLSPSDKEHLTMQRLQRLMDLGAALVHAEDAMVELDKPQEDGYDPSETAATSQASADSALLQDIIHQALGEILDDALDDEERTFLQFRFGIGKDRPHYLEEVVQLMELSDQEGLKLEYAVYKKLGLHSEIFTRLDDAVANIPLRPAPEHAPVFKLLRQGKTESEIRRTLDISSNTFNNIVRGTRRRPRLKHLAPKELWLASPWANELTELQTSIAELHDYGLSGTDIVLVLDKTIASIRYQLAEIQSTLADPAELPLEEVLFNDIELRILTLRADDKSNAELKQELGLSDKQLLTAVRSINLKRIYQDRLVAMQDDD